MLYFKKASCLALAILATGLCTVSFDAFAAASSNPSSAGIQMLPPEGCPNVKNATSGGILSWDSQSPISCIPGVTTNPNGNITVTPSQAPTAASPQAAITAGGSVQVGNDTICNATKAGAIRWTGTELDVCNGTVWVSAFGGVGCTMSSPVVGGTGNSNGGMWTFTPPGPAINMQVVGFSGGQYFQSGGAAQCMNGTWYVVVSPGAYSTPGMSNF